MVLIFSALFVLINNGLWLPLLDDEIGGILSRLEMMCAWAKTSTRAQDDASLIHVGIAIMIKRDVHCTVQTTRYKLVP